MRAPRNLIVGEMATHGDSVFVADKVFPLVAQVDRATGGVKRPVTWPLAGRFFHQPSVTAMTVHEDVLWLSAPSAGGMVRIELADGTTTILPLESPPGDIAVLGSNLVVIAYREWRTAADPTRSQGPSAPPDLPEQPEPRPAWRIGDGVARRIDLQADALVIASLADGCAVMLVERDVDQVVETKHGRGISLFRYPGAIVLIRPDETIEVLRLHAGSGSFIVDGADLWLKGCDVPRVEGQIDLFRLDPETRELTSSAMAHLPSRIVSGVALDLAHQVRPPLVGVTGRATMVLTHVLTGRELGRVDLALPDLDSDETVGASADEVLFPKRDGSELLFLNVRTQTCRSIRLAIPTEPHRPPRVAPDDLDVEGFEEEQRARADAELSGGWVNSKGEVRPYIEGVVFEPVTLEGAYPDTSIVVRFQSDRRPGIHFGSRWYVFDELGDPVVLDWVPLHHMEMIEAAGWGLPRLEDCIPDADGIVWVD